LGSTFEIYEPIDSSPAPEVFLSKEELTAKCRFIKTCLSCCCKEIWRLPRTDSWSYGNS